MPSRAEWLQGIRPPRRCGTCRACCTTMQGGGAGADRNRGWCHERLLTSKWRARAARCSRCTRGWAGADEIEPSPNCPSVPRPDERPILRRRRRHATWDPSGAPSPRTSLRRRTALRTAAAARPPAHRVRNALPSASRHTGQRPAGSHPGSALRGNPCRARSARVPPVSLGVSAISAQNRGIGAGHGSIGGDRQTPWPLSASSDGRRSVHRGARADLAGRPLAGLLCASARAPAKS